MNTSEPLLLFTQQEIDLIGQTADAMSAYMGKPVLAEIMDADDTGAEWVAFAIPLGVDEDVDEDSTVLIQMGGPGARFAGNRGGLLVGDDVYNCECLWIIQLSDDDAGRYVKVDPLSQDYTSSDDLHELLPFAVNDDELKAAQAAEDDEDIEAGSEDADETRRMDQMLDQLLPPSKRLH